MLEHAETEGVRLTAGLRELDALVVVVRLCETLELLLRLALAQDDGLRETRVDVEGLCDAEIEWLVDGDAEGLTVAEGELDFKGDAVVLRDAVGDADAQRDARWVPELHGETDGVDEILRLKVLDGELLAHCVAVPQ